MKQPKQIIKRTCDLAMTVLLPLLMAEILIGQEIHEWLGTVMLGLFFAHRLLNSGSVSRCPSTIPAAVHFHRILRTSWN